MFEKICATCRFMGEPNFASDGSDLTKCLRGGDKRPGVSLVTGQPFREVESRYAEIERNSPSEDKCGPQARFYVPVLQVA